jgi:hypothetical protein
MLDVYEVLRKPEVSCMPLFEQEGWLLLLGSLQIVS